MKRVKVMLMSVAVIAVVGAALAFNVKAKFGTTFCSIGALSGNVCTNTTFPNGRFCNTLVQDKTTQGGTTNICWTTYSSGECSDLRCDQPANATKVE